MEDFLFASGTPNVYRKEKEPGKSICHMME